MHSLKIKKLFSLWVHFTVNQTKHLNAIIEYAFTEDLGIY